MKINEILNLIVSSLQNVYDEREAKNIAYLLLENFLNLPKVKILSSGDEIVDDTVKEKILNSLEELMTHKPLQYVLGHTCFYGCLIKVNKNVLIPRPETEELVQMILNDQKNQKGKIKIMDIGTGSGCIAIALKKNIPCAEVHAMDLMTEALTVAEENALNNKVKINFHHSDIFYRKGWMNFKEFDLIVSNPPYIRNSEKSFMKKNVLDFEPATALFVPDDNAMKYYEIISLFSEKHLTKGGILYFEINEKLADMVSDLFNSRKYNDVVIINDINGRQRFLSCKKP